MTIRTLLLASLALLLGAPAVQAQDSSFSRIEQGRRLVDAADCVSCHTGDKSKPFAGGRGIDTPFGVIYAPNITPDRETGIGAWSDDDFYRALHHGQRPDGARLYPAMPYPYFTKMTRDDVDAMRAFLRTLPAVRTLPRENELMWPLGYRVFMRGWNMLFFTEGTFQPNPDKSAEWNRGAYLVEGPGHCGACHTPKNILGADKSSQALQGGLIRDWFAPNIANTVQDGVGRWSIDELVEYLKTGRNVHSGAAGLMAEVVENSTSKLPEADLRAMAVYLKDADGGGEPAAPSKPDDKTMTVGRAIYNDMCAACHKTDGTGVPRMFSPLAGNANVQQRDATTVMRVILEGARIGPTDARPTPFAMPAFDWKLTDAQIAAVATYVRNSWGNAASPVTAGAVETLRESLHQSRTSGKAE